MAHRSISLWTTQHQRAARLQRPEAPNNSYASATLSAAALCDGAAEGIVLVQRPLFVGTQGILKAIAMGVTGSLLDLMGGAGALLDMAAYKCAETAIISDSIPSIFTYLFDVCTAIDAFVSSYGQCLNHRN